MSHGSVYEADSVTVIIMSGSQEFFFLSNSFTKLLEYRNHVFFLKYGSDHITPARRSSITLLPTEGGLHFAKWFFVSSFLLIPFKNVNSPMLDDPNVSCPLLGPRSNLLGWLQSLRANPMFTVLCKGYLINKVVFNPIAWVQIPSLTNCWSQPNFSTSVCLKFLGLYK